MLSRSTVLLVVRHVGNIRVLTEALTEGGFATASVSGEEELSAALTRPGSRPPVVGLVDTTGFGPAVWRMCEILRAHRVRFIVLSEAKGERTAGHALEVGAVSIFKKPVGKSPLLQLLRTLAQQG